MRTLNYLLLAVADPVRSAAFYSNLLGIQPVENSPSFVLYVLPNGIKLGLWIKGEIDPAPRAAGGIEIGFSEDNNAAVTATYEDWSAKGARILQTPTQMDFGFTFTAEDPDGHRLRVFAIAANPR
ncbi:drug:proton antiporter [Devosia epidermidihirudinis]|uniref:Drug:proton antiporter n=1 Tax=Devosia epidermidihirudinis TaxID=1293439 RepID=A0A0F5QD42_9HYPH|nr:VOC family protein [Devosia epidermidihirudinis]KKC38885.1 drug:proton antiporter [Devosia epidermidihirudinis]